MYKYSIAYGFRLCNGIIQQKCYYESYGASENNASFAPDKTESEHIK